MSSVPAVSIKLVSDPASCWAQIPFDTWADWKACAARTGGVAAAHALDSLVESDDDNRMSLGNERTAGRAIYINLDTSWDVVEEKLASFGVRPPEHYSLEPMPTHYPDSAPVRSMMSYDPAIMENPHVLQDRHVTVDGRDGVICYVGAGDRDPDEGRLVILAGEASGQPARVIVVAGDEIGARIPDLSAELRLGPEVGRDVGQDYNEGPSFGL